MYGEEGDRRGKSYLKAQNDWPRELELAWRRGQKKKTRAREMTGGFMKWEMEELGR